MAALSGLGPPIPPDISAISACFAMEPSSLSSSDSNSDSNTGAVAAASMSSTSPGTSSVCAHSGAGLVSLPHG
eukprot:scaffold13050_cov59-Phaeocystis_antarctica.AAC.2